MNLSIHLPLIVKVRQVFFALHKSFLQENFYLKKLWNNAAKCWQFMDKVRWVL
tara:strand:+ start:34041 stop:34199 length:159 start_codon:yes stop_codon:yes gene_type:complete